jgi:hypothetical protein
VSDRDVKNLLDRLVGDLDEEVGDWDDVLARAGQPIRTRWHWSWRPRPRYLLAGTAAAVAAVVALTVTSPWSGGPSIIDRAAAAILSPSSRQILYERIIFRPSGFVNVPPCRRDPARCGFRGPTVHIRAWVDGARPRNFRIRADGPPGKPFPVKGVVPSEFGGKVGSADGLSYSFADGVLDPVPFWTPITEAVLDPAEYVKASLTAGRAKVDGNAMIRGRRVVRIRIASRPYLRTVTGALFFVDARTYRPVRIELSAALPFRSRVGYPLTCLTFAMIYGCTSNPGSHAMWVYDFAEYRYLPRTAANRKLANIHAMHPGAEII